MKLKHALSLLSLATCAALSTSAFAQNTVQFTGEIVSEACGDVEANGGAAVVLPQQSVGDFPQAGTRQGGTNFKVALDNCKPPTATFAVAFSHADVDTSTGYLTNIGAANVVYELTNTSDVQIPFYQNVTSTTPIHAATPVTPTGAGPHELEYKIWYRSTADTVGTGVTNKTATMTVQYQ